MKRVLLIAGAGTLGGSTYPELLKLGYSVDVISLEDFSSVSPRLGFVKARADLDFLKGFLSERGRYDAIVDFVHTPDEQALFARIDLLLEQTDQFVFLSSYRTYADRDRVITEDSPQWMESTTDPTFLSQDTYAIPKQKGERHLRASGRRNWTIIRPVISFTHYRLDLVTVGAYAILSRSAAGKRILLPEGCRNSHAGVTWGGNTGLLLSRLIGNPQALGDVFTLGSNEVLTWGDVASYYEEFAGAKFEWVPVEDYLAYGTPNTYMHRQMIYADRILDRTVDVSKALRVTGVDPARFMPCRLAVAHELAILSERPDLVARFATEEERARSRRMDEYLTGGRYAWTDG